MESSNFDIHEIGLIVYLCLAVSIVLEVLATRLRRRFIVSRKARK